MKHNKVQIKVNGEIVSMLTSQKDIKNFLNTEKNKAKERPKVRNEKRGW